MNPGGPLTLTRLSVNHSTTASKVETETTFTHTRTASPCVSGEVCIKTQILILIMFFWRLTLPLFVCFFCSISALQAVGVWSALSFWIETRWRRLSNLSVWRSVSGIFNIFDRSVNMVNVPFRTTPHEHVCFKFVFGTFRDTIVEKVKNVFWKKYSVWLSLVCPFQHADQVSYSILTSEHESWAVTQKLSPLQEIHLNWCLFAVDPHGGVKPGFCPEVDTNSLGICSQECGSDSECLGTQKCCSNGCGTYCTEPEQPGMWKVFIIFHVLYEF